MIWSMDRATPLRNALLHRLKSGAWQAGQRLPTERALSEQFQISRSTVRQVLAQLTEMGLINRMVGSGTYVSEQAPPMPNGLGSHSPAQTISPAELMDARMVLEPAIIEMVAGSATLADFARLEACCSSAEAAPSAEAFEHWDGKLHEAIAEAAHNNFVSSVFRLMNEVRNQGEWGMLKERSLTPDRRTQYEQQHRQLVAALKDRDVARARTLSQAHLVQVRRNLLGY